MRPCGPRGRGRASQSHPGGAGMAASALLAAGGLASLGIVAEGRPGSPADNLDVLTRTKGYVYAGYFPKFVPHLPEGDEQRLSERFHSGISLRGSSERLPMVPQRGRADNRGSALAPSRPSD